MCPTADVWSIEKIKEISLHFVLKDFTSAYDSEVYGVLMEVIHGPRYTEVDWDS